MAFLHHRGQTNLYFAFLFVLLVSCIIPLTDGGLSTIPTAPSRDQCLYFSDDYGVARVLTVDATQGALVQASQQNPNGTVLPDKGNLLQVLNNIGYYAGGLVIHDNILYVASLRLIARYDLSNNLQRLENFVEFAFVPYECLPDGLFVWGEVLYASCGAFVGANNSFPLLKFSLADHDYGTFLNSSGYPDWTTGRLFFYQGLVANGSFAFTDYFTWNYFNATGPFIFFTGLSLYAAIPLINETAWNQPGDLYQFSWSGDYYYYGATVPNSYVLTDTEYWNSFTWGEDGNMYMVRNYVDLNDYYWKGSVECLDGTTGRWLFTLVNGTRDLEQAVGIVMSPTGDFLVAASSATSVSYIYVYDKKTGENKGAFYAGTPGNDILPREMIWGPCPVTPEQPSETDNTLAIVLGVVVPVLALPACCLLLLLLLLIIFLLIKEINDRRRRTYFVHDDDRVEMGRRGKTIFTYREIDPDELEVGTLLGQGAYGKVYRGTFRGAPVAIKTFDQIKLDEADEETLAEIREEAQMMERLGNHPNVISFVGAITNPSTKGHQLHFSLVTEFCPNGSLFDFLIKKRSKIPLITLIKMARDIAAGILHLHKEKVIHRDIATRNILVGNDLTVYLSDFGMARIKNQDVNTTVANVGPVKWMAPECMLHRQYSEASDAFSYGVTLWEMVTRKIPWKGMDVAQIIIAVAQKNTRLEVPPDTDPILKKIIKGVWRSAPEKRMTMAEIVSKLDTYYKSLLEVYEDMSSDDDGDAATDRSYFKYNSAERSSRSTIIGGRSRRPTMNSTSQDATDNATEMSDVTFSYATIAGGSGDSVSSSSGGGGTRKGKGKEKESGNDEDFGEDEDLSNYDHYGVLKTEKNYGVLPERGDGLVDKNYGEIPNQDRENYGDLPADMYQAYAEDSKNKKKKNKNKKDLL